MLSQIIISPGFIILSLMDLTRDPWIGVFRGLQGHILVLGLLGRRTGQPRFRVYGLGLFKDELARLRSICSSLIVS